MAGYRIRIKASAAKEIDRIGSRADRSRIVTRISSLASTPRPRGGEKLAGREHHFRIRQGDFRIIYVVDDGASEITIFKVGHRRDVYR